VTGRNDNDIMWPASVRAMADRRMELVLERRFEPGTSLSVFLPEPGSDSSCTVFVRVARVEALAGSRWLLDCASVTPLSPERIQTLLRLDCGPQAAPETRLHFLGATTVSTVRVMVTRALFQVRLGNRHPIRRPVTRLYVNGCWPLLTGQAMKMWVGNGPLNDSSADIRVNGCYKQDGVWLVDCSFLGAPPPVLIEQLQTGIM
jgi:hypothetical protein